MLGAFIFRTLSQIGNKHLDQPNDNCSPGLNLQYAAHIWCSDFLSPWEPCQTDSQLSVVS